MWNGKYQMRHSAATGIPNRSAGLNRPGVQRAAVMASAVLLAFLPGSLAAAERVTSGFLTVSPENPYFPFLMLFGLMLAGLTFFRPKIGLTIMLLFIMVSTDMPMRGESVGSRAVTIRIEDLVLVLVSGGWLLNRARSRSLALSRNVPVNRAILPMALMIILSMIFGQLQGTADLRSSLLFGMKRLEYFWIFFMALNLIETEAEAWRAARLFLGASAVIAMIGAVQFFLFPISALTAGGATSTLGFGRANTFADFLLIVIGLALGLMIFARTRQELLLTAGGFILFLAALLLTKSRGAYVSLLPLLVVVLLVTRSPRLVTVLWILSGLTAGYFAIKLAVGGEPELLISHHYDDFGYQFASIGRVAKEGIEGDSSLYVRYAYFWQDVERALKYPLLGRGVGSVPLAFFDVHYKRELHETGLLGLLAFFIMNGTILLTAFRFYLRTANPLYKGLAVGFFGGHVGILVHALTIENFYTIFNMEAFWFFLALLMVFYHHEELRSWRGAGADPGYFGPPEPEPEASAVPEGAAGPTPDLPANAAIG